MRKPRGRGGGRKDKQLVVPEELNYLGRMLIEAYMAGNENKYQQACSKIDTCCEWVEEEERAGRHAPPLKRCEVYLDGTDPGLPRSKAWSMSPEPTASLRPRLGRLPSPFAENVAA
jgi:hypothetical protein